MIRETMILLMWWLGAVLVGAFLGNLFAVAWSR